MSRPSHIAATVPLEVTAAGSSRSWPASPSSRVVQPSSRVVDTPHLALDAWDDGFGLQDLGSMARPFARKSAEQRRWVSRNPSAGAGAGAGKRAGAGAVLRDATAHFRDGSQAIRQRRRRAQHPASRDARGRGSTAQIHPPGRETLLLRLAALAPPQVCPRPGPGRILALVAAAVLAAVTIGVGVGVGLGGPGNGGGGVGVVQPAGQAVASTLSYSTVLRVGRWGLGLGGTAHYVHFYKGGAGPALSCVTVPCCEPRVTSRGCVILE
jgi:hypothetical protein